MPDPYFLDQYRRKAGHSSELVQSGRGERFDVAAFLHVAREMLDLLQPDRAHAVLDLGCANGLLSILLSALSRQVVAVEPVPELAELARRNLAGCPNARVESGHGSAIPVADSSFDLVLMLEVLQVVPGEEAATVFAELRRVARNGARIVIGSVPDARRRDAVQSAYLAGVRSATHLSDEQKSEIVARNLRSTWYEPDALVEQWRRLGCSARVQQPLPAYPNADHRFHLVVHVSK